MATPRDTMNFTTPTVSNTTAIDATAIDAIVAQGNVAQGNVAHGDFAHGNVAHDAMIERMEALLSADDDDAVAELAALCILAETFETRSLVGWAAATH